MNKMTDLDINDVYKILDQLVNYSKNIPKDSLVYLMYEIFSYNPPIDIFSVTISDKDIFVKVSNSRILIGNRGEYIKISSLNHSTCESFTITLSAKINQDEFLKYYSVLIDNILKQRFPELMGITEVIDSIHEHKSPCNI